jgi:hypothetical protein
MLRQALIAITRKSDIIETAKDLGILARTMLTRRRSLGDFFDGMGETEAFHAAETGTWIDAEAISEGQQGPFDACDLPAYLAIAKAAGVPSVPARIILALSEEEADAASGKLNLTDPRSTRILEKLARSLPAPSDETTSEGLVDREEVTEKLMAAMDEIPEGWMVRHARAGGSNLKTLAGSGVAGGEVPEIKFGPNLEVGPGWVRVGNRRMVDVSDRRTVQAIAEGPGGTTRFVARPWVKASRWRTGDDPHRQGTPFAGKGSWPCEWRAFIVDGKVVGVSNYYGWLGEATPLDAKMAIAVRELAQSMADLMVQRSLFPRFMDTEFARRRPEFAEKLAGFGREQVACTLDFIETHDGLLFLEGGPAHSAFGGGHCCAFAGTRGAPVIGNAMDVSGVAFTLLPGVVLADMASWKNGEHADRAGAILDWEAVELLASETPSV